MSYLKPLIKKIDLCFPQDSRLGRHYSGEITSLFKRIDFKKTHILCYHVEMMNGTPSKWDQIAIRGKTSDRYPLDKMGQQRTSVVTM